MTRPVPSRLARRLAAATSAALALTFAVVPASGATAGADLSPGGTSTLTGTLVVVADHNVDAGTSLYAIQTPDGQVHPVDVGAAAATFEAASSGDYVVAAVDGAGSSGGEPEVVSASVTPAVEQAGSAVVADVYLVAVDDPLEAGDVTLAQAQTSTQESLAYWARDGRGVFDNGRVAAARTWTKSGSCALDYWTLWSQASALFPGVSFGTGEGNHLVVFSPSTCAKPYAGIATVGSAATTGGTVQIVGNLPAALTHELGHNFGLGHSDLEYVNASGALVTADYYGTFGPQGPVIANEKPSSLDMAYQNQLGVPGAAAATTTTATDTDIDLSASNATAGTRALKFTDPVDGRTYYVEYRPGTGSDVPSFYTGPYVNGGLSLGGLPIWYSAGVRIYRHDGYDVTTVSRRQGASVRATFQDGETYTPPTNAFTVTASALTSTTAHVRLAFSGGGGPATPPPPGKAKTTVTGQIDVKPYGQTSKLTVTVTAAGGATPTGAVELYENGSSTGNGAGSGNPMQVTFGLTGWTPGTHTVDMRYPGDGTTQASSAPITFTVPKAPTTAALVTTPASGSSAGTAVVDVSVFAPAISYLQADGQVEIYNGSTRLAVGTVVAGTVSVPLPLLPGGTYTLTARYLGSSTAAPSSASATYQVAGADTTLTASASGSQVGSPAVVAVAVTSAAGTPTGLVSVFDGSALLASGTLSAGAANVALPASLPAGTYTVSVRYAGTSVFAASSAQVTFTVSAAATSMTTTGAAWKFGAPVPVKVKVTSSGPAAATGTVELYDGGVKVGEGVLIGGVASILLPAGTPAGSRTLQVRYGGDGTVAAASGTVGVVVSPASSAVSASIKSSIVGAAAVEVRVDVDTRVMANGGTAAIYSGGVKLAEAPVVAGVARVSLATLPVGLYSWTAVYSGTGDIASGQYVSAIALRVRV